MNRAARRSTVTLLLLLGLVAGMIAFGYRYVTQAPDWASSVYNPHVDAGANLVISDRGGELLLDDTDGRTYSDDAELREAMVHWLGDREGNIKAPELTYYARKNLGYDLFSGLHNHSNEGGTVQMTLSAGLQKTALEALDGRKGTVGVYNYRTGEILCAVSAPGFDPDHVPADLLENDAYSGAYVNRFTQGAYVPGSIFKIVTTAAALDTLEDPLDLEFNCDGSWEMGSDVVNCEGVHGTIGLKTALAKSCNSYFAQLAQELGAETLEKYVRQLRVTEPLQFDGITTRAGSFDLSGAAPVEVSWSAIGQYTDLVNPSRYMTLMGVIANGGNAAEPHIIGSAQYGTDQSYRARPHMTGSLLDPQTCETLRELMHNNVVRIYGEDNFPRGMTVCAKSGTAQVGGDREPHATFAGFVTDEEYPLAFLVVVENGGSGSGTCVPIVSKVLRACRDLLDAE